MRPSRLRDKNGSGRAVLNCRIRSTDSGLIFQRTWWGCLNRCSRSHCRGQSDTLSAISLMLCRTIEAFTSGCPNSITKFSAKWYSNRSLLSSFMSCSAVRRGGQRGSGKSFSGRSKLSYTSLATTGPNCLTKAMSFLSVSAFAKRMWGEFLPVLPLLKSFRAIWYCWRRSHAQLLMVV